MLAISISDFDFLRLKHLVSDFTMSLEVYERHLPNVKELLKNVAWIVKLHVVKADTFGTAQAHMKKWKVIFDYSLWGRH